MKAGLLGAAGIALAVLLPGELQVAVDPALPSYRPTGVVGVAATLVGPYWLSRSVIALALKFNELEPRASVRVLAVAGAEAHQTMPAAAPAMIRFDEVVASCTAAWRITGAGRARRFTRCSTRRIACS